MSAETIAAAIAEARAQQPWHVEPDYHTGEATQVQNDPRIGINAHDIIDMAGMLTDAMNGWCPEHIDPNEPAGLSGIDDECTWCKWDAVRRYDVADKAAKAEFGGDEEPF